MKRLLLVSNAVLLLTATLAAGSAWGASYQKIDGTIVDPILCLDNSCGGSGTVHPYNGPNLEPFANLPGVYLSGADLSRANLPGVYLSGANLYFAILIGATLTGVQSGGIIGTPIALPTSWRTMTGTNEGSPSGKGQRLRTPREFDRRKPSRKER